MKLDSVQHCQSYYSFIGRITYRFQNQKYVPTETPVRVFNATEILQIKCKRKLYLLLFIDNIQVRHFYFFLSPISGLFIRVVTNAIIIDLLDIINQRLFLSLKRSVFYYCLSTDIRIFSENTILLFTLLNKQYTDFTTIHLYLQEPTDIRQVDCPQFVTKPRSIKNRSPISEHHGYVRTNTTRCFALKQIRVSTKCYAA